MANSENVVNQLLGAIDTVIGKRLEQLAYDKTIICTIIDDSQAKNGEYRVTDGSVKFWAKCENANYRIDDQVRVSVPNGDTSQEKFIIGKYTTNSSNTPITYMTPLSSVLKMSGDICSTAEGNVYGLKASGPNSGVPTRTGVLLWSADIDAEAAAMTSSQIYDVIYVQADFKTILSNYNIKSGSYGLMLSLGTVLADGVTPGPPVTCMFESSQMFGNPYAFGIFTTQAAKFDITNVGKLSSVQLLFYQDGNFTHNTNTIEPVNIPQVDGINNILIKNVKVGFGTDVSKIADETVKLFTTDDLRYDNDTTSAITNTKHLKLAWYNKDENGQYLGFDDAIPDADGNIFINEDTYLTAAGENAFLQSQQNYDIPLDRTGLELAAETRAIKDSLLAISASLGSDAKTLLTRLKTRCDIENAALTTYLNEIETLLTNQVVTIGTGEDAQTMSFTDAINAYYEWHMGQLNNAASKWNVSILPTQVNGSWQFKGTPLSKGLEPGYYDAFSNYVNAVYNKLYPSGRFMQPLYDLVTGSYTGYRGIYDDADHKFTELITKLKDQWTKTLVDKLYGNNTEMEAYFNNSYSFHEWTASDLSAQDGKYCVYWYRYNGSAAGDNFASRGWERIPGTDNNITGITVECDAVNNAKEEFKAIIIYNHEKYESNILTFENNSPVVNAATAQLSDKIHIKHSTNSREAYQSYGVSNLLVNGADKFVRRELKLEFTHSDGTVDNEVLTNAQVYWYVPQNATMLTYDTADLLNLNSANNFTNDIGASGQSAMQRDGYTCFYKTIGYGNAGNSDKDLTFSYRIKDYYLPTAANNTIYCTVVKGEVEYKAEILMNFSSYGSSGTDYTLAITSDTRQAAITPDSVGDKAWRLNITLYDNKNEPISDYALKTVRLKVSGSKYNVQGPLSDDKGYYCLISMKETDGILCDILEVVASGVQHGDSLVDLTAFYPIAYTSNSNYYIEGATTVVYDSQGGNPSYYKDPYKLFQQATPNGIGDSGQVSGTWSIAYSPTLAEGMGDYMPILKDGALLPSNMWVEGGDRSYAFLQDQEEPTPTTHYTYVQCTDDGGNVLWSQPILIIQNRYPSPMLNAWDGKFKIDEENGTVMSTMVSAGRKTSKNTFEGVMMGDISDVGNPDNKSGLGIYGFNDGAQSFGLNIDGTAFFGKSGRGRLLFDGNSGTISSASYQQTTHRGLTPAGMMIDLDDGFIDMRGTEAPDANGNYTSNGTQSQIHIDVKSPYFYIKSKDGNELIHIGDNYDESTSSYTSNYYFQTNDYRPSSLWSGETFNTAGTSGLGMRLDLGDGRIDAYKFMLKGENANGSYVALSDSDNAFLRIKYRSADGAVNVDVMDVGVDTYQLHSFDWLSGAQGTEIDFGSGRWVSYCNVSGDYNGKAILINADANDVPFAVGGSGTIDNIMSEAAFKLYWDGSFSVAGDAFKVSSSGQLNVQGTAFQVTPQGDLSLGDGKFKVDSNGNLVIKGTGDGVNTYAFKVQNTGDLSLGSGAFQVSASGQLTVNNIFKVTPGGVLTVKETNATTFAFKVDADGNLSLGSGMFKVDATGNMSLGKRTDENGAELSVFFVSKDGEMTINGTAFSVSPVGKLSIGNELFNVKEDGSMWSGDKDQAKAKFSVTNAGVMSSTGATINNATVTGTLTVNSQFLMTKATDKFEVKSTDIFIGESSSGSNIHINGNTSIGAAGPTSSAAKNYRLYIDGKVGIGGETKVTGNLTTEKGVVTLGGNTSVTGNLSFTGGLTSEVTTLSAVNPWDAGTSAGWTSDQKKNLSGIDGKIRITMEESGFWWWQDATEAYLIFAKGILVGIEKI